VHNVNSPTEVRKEVWINFWVLLDGLIYVIHVIICIECTVYINFRIYCRMLVEFGENVDILSRSSRLPHENRIEN
jgi:hypothetical protein